MTSKRFDKDQVRVAIIGAGVGGLAAAIALKRQLKFANFLIYEKATDIGGTWEANTYPGCASDVGGHWYSLSTDPNPHWNNYYATQPELQEYWRGLVNKYALYERLVLSTLALSAEWDNVRQVYTVKLRDERTGEEWEETAEFVVDATGGLSSPAFPNDVKDREAFKGEQFHSARWRSDIELKGKRVGVVGNGCSAAQFVPIITQDPSTEVVNFCRTPQWFTPRVNFAYPAWAKWSFANLPLAGRVYRILQYFRYEMSVALFMPQTQFVRRFVQKGVEDRIARKARKEYVEKLIPNYPTGCKRIIIDPGYLTATNRPNFSLTFDTIDAVVPEGMRMKNGDIVPLDVIIWATGFNVLNVGLNAKGSDGKLISEFYEARGGPEAYLGSTIPGFPNFFLLMGPNTATGHASIIFSEECQINYMLQLMKPVIDRKATSFEVRRAASSAYNAKIQKLTVGTVWTQCVSWYKAGNKNVAIFPGPLFLFWWWTLSPRWEDYIAKGAERWEAERTRKRILKILLAVALVTFSAGLSQPTFREVVLTACTRAVSTLRNLF